MLYFAVITNEDGQIILFRDLTAFSLSNTEFFFWVKVYWGKKSTLKGPEALSEQCDECLKSKWPPYSHHLDQDV